MRSRGRDLLVWVLLALPAVAIVLAVARRAPISNLSVSVLVVGLIFLLLRAAFRARQRIVIQPFADPNGETALAGIGIELAARLQHDLARIQSLYEVVDEVLPAAANKSLGVTMGVEDIGEIFKEAVGPSSKIKVAGLVEIPIGAILSAIGFFVRGPRITGSLLRQVSADGKSHGFLLLAEISGGGQSGSWQVGFEEKLEVQTVFASDLSQLVDREPPSQPATSETLTPGLRPTERAELARLIELLAYRIFTSLVPSGSPRWQAVRHFTEGLRAYRSTQRSPRRKSLLLHEAEREFLLALGEDTQFARCHCNLGVIYNQMGLQEAEEAALRQALAQDSTTVDAYLGLAALRLDQGEHQSAGRHSDNGLRIDPWHPRLWNLRAISLLRCPTRAPEWRRRDDPAWRECLPYLNIATALAWRQMVRHAGSGRSAQVAKARRVTVICLGNLALATASAGKLKAARSLFRQALRLGDDPWWLAFELGRALYLAPAKLRARRLKLLRGAGVALDRVYDEALDGESRIELNLYLLGIHLALQGEEKQKPSRHRPKAEDAYAFILDQMVMERWDTKHLQTFLEDAEKPLKILGSDTTGHFARLRALGRAVPLLMESAAEPSANGEKIDLEVGKQGLKWLEEGLDVGDPTELCGTSASAMSSMRLLLEVLDIGWPSWTDVPMVSAWRHRARELRAQRVEDWRWLYAQMQLRSSITALERQDKSLAASAAKALEEAIKRLHEHGLQIRNQWLYRWLAKAYLLEALRNEPPTRALLCKALAAGRKAVAWNPQEPTGFLVLGQIYAALNDWPQARQEWEKALSFGTTPEIWLEIAETYLSQGSPPVLLGAETEDERIDRLQFLREGLHQVESRPAGDHDDRWLQAHGAIHLCLGLAQLDRGCTKEAASNLSTARSLGYRSKDAEIALAQAHAKLSGAPRAVITRPEGVERPLLTSGSLIPKPSEAASMFSSHRATLSNDL
jgi:tetratricopeptide (TPR) repeat protein